jgi:AcrR family transcriptional regulator
MSVPSGKSRRVSTKRKKRSRRHSPEEARREIMDSAVRFLWEHDFRDLTIGELMGDTPLSRPAFYQYFKDLHGLIEALLSEVGAVMHQTAHPWINGEGEPIAALRESLKGVVQTCVHHGPVFRAVSEAAPLDERLEQTWSEFMGLWDDQVESRIKAQQREGLISKSLPARRIANALNSLDATLLIAEFGRRPQGDPKAVLDTLHHVWVATLYSQPPRKLRTSN